MKTPGFARKLKNRILGSGVKPHVPCFSERALVSALCGYLASAPQGFVPPHEPGTGRLPARRDDVAAYFGRRRSPSFFADSATLRALARDIASRRPEWRDRLLAKAAADTTDGLKIYAMKGPVLRPGFPWGGLDPEPNDDDLYSIRPHRFGFAPRHALAILYGVEPATSLAEILEDWMAFAERGTSDFPYCSALVVIQRLLSLSWARAFVMALPEPDAPATMRLHADILQILRADIEFLLPRLGESAPNNHLLADRFAAWYIRLQYPEFVPGPSDLDACETVWLAELDRQVYADGTGFEHSLHYHEFGCEMVAAYALLCRRNAHPIPSGTLETMERMLGFQAGLAGPNTVTLAFGDATEDPLFALDPGEGWATAGLRELYRAMFDPALSPAPPTHASVERAFWLLGGALAPQASPSVAEDTGSRLWRDGGFCVLPDASKSARLIFRTGPAGHHDLIPGHMHADLLSICVALGDTLVLTDPGTWCYRWRKSETGPARGYFSGPTAHNGLTIDAVDPLGTVQGDFRGMGIPVRVATTRCLLGERLRWLEAEIRGGPPYAGHRRGVVHVVGAYWIVYDVLPAGIGMRHQLTLGFQTAAGVEATRDESGITWLESRAGMMWLAAGSGLDAPRIIRGESDPPGGWVSPRYGEVVPATQLRYGIANGTIVATLILGTGMAVARPVAVRALPTGLAIDITDSAALDRLLLATHDEDINVQTDAVHGQASAVWTRHGSNGFDEVRCLAFRETQWIGENARGLPGRDGAPAFPVDQNRREVEWRVPSGFFMTLSGEVRR